MSVTFLICLKRFDIIFQTLKKIIQFDIIYMYFEMKKNIFFYDFFLMWSEFFFMITDTVDLHIHVYTDEEYQVSVTHCQVYKNHPLIFF